MYSWVSLSKEIIIKINLVSNISCSTSLKLHVFSPSVYTDSSNFVSPRGSRAAASGICALMIRSFQEQCSLPQVRKS